jgi:glycosyltransferase involved in cell wall biosynthesis
VSIVVPCRNEAATIGPLLDGVYRQTYPRKQLEVVIADAGSTDGTLQAIAAFRARHPDLAVAVVDNPARSIPAGLNRAIAAARGAVIVRLDGHSRPHPGYVERCVAALEAGRGDNVGGVWEIHPGAEGWAAAAIAAAAAHPLAVGDARYRYASTPAAVDTVPFGAFRRELLERVGTFDEGLLTNEDYEFNVRVRKGGGVVWLDPAIRSTYVARPTFAALARQYWRYGFWKARMLRRYPETLRWRQAGPPLFVAALGLLAPLAARWRAARLALSAILAAYGLALLATGSQVARRAGSPALLLTTPLAVAVMHLAWGAGFLWSLAAPAKGGPR